MSHKVTEAAEAAPAAHGRIYGLFASIKARIEQVKAHPVQGVGWSVVVALAGLGASEAYSSVKARFADEDQYIASLRKQQSDGFADIKRDLAQLRGTGDSSLVRKIGSAVEKISSAQDGLIKQLELAKLEAQRQSEARARAGSAPGGYDFILTNASGLALSQKNFLGVQWMSGTRVSVNLSTVGAKDLSRDLRSGQSLPFRNDQGRECSVALLSIESGAASFKVGCA